MKLLNLAVKLFVSAAVLVVGIMQQKQFLPITDNYDGFALQLAHAASLFSDQDIHDALGDSWLFLVHLVRLAIATPFLSLEAIAGPVGPVSLLLLLLLPLTHVPGRDRQGFLTLLPMALPLFISGRGVLAAVSVGYIVMYMIERRSIWMLVLGSLLANLSSASVLMCLLLLLFGYVSRSRSLSAWSWQRLTAIAFLAISLAISTQDKITGFNAGQPGYQAQFDGSDNIFIALVSRSTIFVSFAEGQLARSLFYSAVATFLIIKMVALLAAPKLRTARRILLCCLPGILLEGLGVLGMIFPLIWLFAGFNEQSGEGRVMFRST